MTVNVDALMEVMNVMRSIVELTKRGVIGWVISDVMENGVVFKGSLSPYTFTLSVQVVPYMSKVLVVQSENQPAAPPLSLAQIFSFTVKENETVVLHHTSTQTPQTPSSPSSKNSTPKYTRRSTTKRPPGSTDYVKP